MSFVPIRLDEYLELYQRANPDTDVAEVRERLTAALGAFKSGTRCDCGGAIWVIGSAEAGFSCFTCITGEATPSDDFELEEACAKPEVKWR